MKVKNENNRVFIGIDVGKEGAIAVLLPCGKVETYLFPRNPDNSYNLPAMFKVFKKLKKYIDRAIVTIEDVHSIKGASAGSSWSFASGKAYIEAFLVAVGFDDFNRVNPQVWQRVIFRLIPMQSDTKKSSIFFTEANYPLCKLIVGRTKKHDGIADAVCIAHYSKLCLNL
jgi:hypothetical protein